MFQPSTDIIFFHSNIRKGESYKMSNITIPESINIVYRILGKNTDTGIEFHDNYIIAEKKGVILKIKNKFKPRTPFILPMDIAMMIKDIADTSLLIKNNDREIRISAENQEYRLRLKVPKRKIDNELPQYVAAVDFEKLKKAIVPILPILNIPFGICAGSICTTMLVSDGRILKIITTNGACLVLNKIACSYKFKLCIDKNIKPIFKIKYNGDLKIYTNKYYTVFVADDCEMYIPSTAEKYPNIDKFLKTEKSFTVNRNQMLRAMQRFLKSELAPVSIRGTEKSLVMHMRTENNSLFERINVDGSAEEFRFVLNPNYLKIILKSLKNENITVNYNKGETFVTISDNDSIGVLAAVKNRGKTRK